MTEEFKVVVFDFISQDRYAMTIEHGDLEALECKTIQDIQSGELCDRRKCDFCDHMAMKIENRGSLGI